MQTQQTYTSDIQAPLVSFIVTTYNLPLEYLKECLDSILQLTLSDKEREQFTNLFILKYSGALGNLPDYVVGGNNDDFFRKVFIYLGQYRDRIPNGLLAKMYKFAVRK